MKVIIEFEVLKGVCATIINGKKCAYGKWNKRFNSNLLDDCKPDVCPLVDDHHQSELDERSSHN